MLAPALTGLAFTVALGCGSSLEPGSVQGTWYLHAYNDSAVPGPAVFRTAADSSVIEIDSVRLDLAGGGECDWLVHLTGQPANTATTCAWTVDAGDDDVMVTVDQGFVLRGDVLPAALRLRDPNGNVLRFEPDPPQPEPEQPEPLAGRRR
jgi:hypothetical protein